MIGLFKAQLFMRWLANEENMGQNINDLKDEGQGRLVELTIRYQDCEWSLSCSESDYRGHENAKGAAKIPHYHMQFRFKKQSFVKFNDYHLPLDADDIEIIKRLKENPEVSLRFSGGQSIGDLFAYVSADELVKSGTAAGEWDEAPLTLNTIIIAEEGKSIGGDDLADLFERARAKGVTVSSLIPELKGVIASTIVSAGPGVVEQTSRGGRGKK
jgi:hypothetical protein